MQPIIVPASGCSLLFTGFSAIGFAFAAVTATPLRSTTENEAIIYYVFNGIGMLMALMAALPLQCALTRHRLRNAVFCGSLATIAYVVSVVFGLLETYEIYDAVSSPNGGELYFLSWISAVCSSIVNGVLTLMAVMTLCYPKKDAETIVSPPPDIEMPPKRKTPKSRADLGK